MSPKLAAEKKQQRKKQKHKKQKSGKEPELTFGGLLDDSKESKLQIEYVTSGIDEADPAYEHFAHVFAKLQPVLEEPKPKAPSRWDDGADEQKEKRKAQEVDPAEKPLSRKQRKQLKRLDVAQLKQLVSRPDVVEVHDASAADPKLLVFLKSYRNTVGVPKHWSQKKKYLAGKRGYEKGPFNLPAFIADTGIAKIRTHYLEREEAKRAKQRQKDKVQPKLGKIDIDYQVLHDAFFKYQTKPKMTYHGDLYCEGKEFEAKLPDHKPGVLSDKLKKALGMPDGAPPPWLINMQRHGPPPAYPNMKIPGLNAPIPPGASFGYHPGGWGKPPVDEVGNPLYGDVFGVESKDEEYLEPVDQKLWGEMEDESSADESDDDVDDVEEDQAGGVDVVDDEGFNSTAPPMSEGVTETTESVTGTDTGTETPDIVQIKKFGARDTDQKLYHTLEQQKAHVGTNIMGSAYTYALPNKADVEISLGPGEVEQYQDPSVIQEKYERAVEEVQERLRAEREGIDEVINEHNKRSRKDTKGREKKPHKAFKF